MTWAVTFDFHNTIAQCDAWFDLEVHNLVPAFFDWQRRSNGSAVPSELADRGRARYRMLRRRVLDSGNEIDAARSLELVLESLEISVSREIVDRALLDIFSPTVACSKPLSGVVDAVHRLHASRVPMAVVSSAAYHPFLEWTLDKFGISCCFDIVLTSASTGYYKSTPKIYTEALNSLGVQPERCIHVGDSERFDVLPARSLGIRTVLVDWHNRRESPATRADLRLETLIGLPEQLQNVFGLTIAN